MNSARRSALCSDRRLTRCVASQGAFHGIFDLATATGTTIAAAYAAVQMAKQIPGPTVVIAAPCQSLADQWCETLEAFNIRPVQCCVSKANWQIARVPLRGAYRLRLSS